jgi:predicted transposase YbfD/YdcC
MLKVRLPELRLCEVKDPRHRRGRRWRLPTLLSAVLAGMLCGSRSLSDVERLTAALSGPIRRLLGVNRRIADTTLRDLLCRLDVQEVRKVLHRAVRGAHRRKALAAVRLPFGVVAMDGKCTSIDGVDDTYAQLQSADGEKPRGVVRTVTSTLSSCAAKPCLDAFPIDPSTNEMGCFPLALAGLLAAYDGLDLFRMVTYDAGACSEANARFIDEQGLYYLLRLTDAQPTLLAEAQRHLSYGKAAVASTTDVVNGRVTEREVWFSSEMAGFLSWSHLKTVVRVRSRTTDKDGNNPVFDDRYFVSSCPAGTLSAEQWLMVVRNHWAVENNCHHTFDVAFREDAQPWVTACPRGMLVVALLRRIAYNLLTLYRTVTQRSEEKRAVPWRGLMRSIYDALIAATDAQLAGLRGPRGVAATL